MRQGCSPHSRESTTSSLGNFSDLKNSTPFQGLE